MAEKKSDQFCWLMTNCPPQSRKNCPAYHHFSSKCWNLKRATPGVSFCADIRCEDCPVFLTRESASESRDVNSGVVLIVDDELLIRWSICKCLSKPGLEVVQARDSAEAFKAISSRQFTHAIIDWKLPGEDGISIARKLHETQPDCIILMTTGGPVDELELKSKELGARCTQKPMDSDTLERLIP